MRREDVLRELAAHKRVIKSYGVKHLSIFGTVARDEAGPASDVDILVEFVGLQQYLEDVIDARVDLVTEDGLRQEMRDQILREAIPAAQRVKRLATAGGQAEQLPRRHRSYPAPAVARRRRATLENASFDGHRAR